MEDKVIEKEAEQSDEFMSGKECYEIYANDDSISLKCIKTSRKPFSVVLSAFDRNIKLFHVISVSCEIGEMVVDMTGQPIAENRCFEFLSTEKICFKLIIAFWAKKENHKRRLEKVTLLGNSEDDCAKWKNLIDEKLKAELEKQNCVRPKNLLVVVNPYSGKKNGKRVHKNIISPLFKVAGIDETVIYTEYPGHAKEYLQTVNLSAYDGVIAAGGDGTISEVANGMLVQEQRNRNILFDDEETNLDIKPNTFAKPKLRLGFIPVGSGNSAHWSTVGTGDYETAALHIICGESHPFDVASVYNDEGKFMQFSVVACWYGFFAKACKMGEDMRMFGPGRYDIAFLRMLIKHEAYPCEVSYLLSSPDNSINISKEKRRCRYPCAICLDKTSNDEKLKRGNSISLSPDSRTSIEEESAWKVTRGRFHLVNFCSKSMIYDKSPAGFAPAAHLADGAGDILLLHETPRKGLFDYLLSLRDLEPRLDLPFMEFLRVKAFRIRPLTNSDLESSSDQEKSSSNVVAPLKSNDEQEKGLIPDTKEGVWTVDGDFLNSRSFTVWVHKGLIDVFAKGIEE